MSAYGDMLAPFPELFEEYAKYKLTPKVGGGYEVTADGTVTMILQTNGSRLSPTNAMSGVMDYHLSYDYWARTPLAEYECAVKIGTQLFRPVGGEAWDSQGGFYRGKLELFDGYVSQPVNTGRIVGVFE